MTCLTEWRRWIRPLVVILYTVILLVGLPLIIVDFQLQKTQINLQAWLISGVFVFLTMPISLWGITQHLVHYTRPDLQRCIIRMLWMVPIYSLNAWFALRFKSAAIYLDTIRECYEAYVIYNFMSFLLKYLHSEYPDLEYAIERKPQVKHPIPFCFLPTWPMGKVCELAGKYHEGDFDFRYAWSYFVIINNISQVWAMYCLVLFYMATKEELAPIHPVGKFMCVKAVVFLSFWQAALIAMLVKVGVIKKSATWGFYEVQDIANGLQDFIICIEMFLAAIGHYFSFSHKPYVDYAAGYSNVLLSFRSMWDVSDVRQDVVDHVRHVGKTVTRPLRGDTGSVSDDPSTAPPRANSEHTPLLTSCPSLSGDEAPPLTPPPAGRLRGDTSDEDDHLLRSTTESMINYAEFSDSGAASGVGEREGGETQRAASPPTGDLLRSFDQPDC